MKLRITILLAVIFSLLFFNSCNQEQPVEPEPTPEPPVYENGEGEIGSIGGTVKIVNPSSPLNGAYVIIPAGAINQPTNISISVGDNDVKFLADTTAIVVQFKPKGLIFNEPVEIGLPYKISANQNLLQAFYLEPDSHKIIQIPLVGINASEHIAKANTIHFSNFVVDDNGTHATVKMYYNSNKIYATVAMDGYVFNTNVGLAGVPTLAWSWPFGMYNAKQVVDNGEFLISGSSPKEVLRVKLKKKVSWWKDKVLDTKTLIYKRIGNLSAGLGGELYIDHLNGSWSTDSELLYTNEVQTSSQREEWFSGDALVFRFDYDPKPDEEYYIEASWVIGGGFTFHIIFGHATEIYTFNNYDYRQNITQMSNINLDQNQNYINDSYETPNLPPNQPSNPNPPNGSTNQSVNTNLSWSGSDPDNDPLTYDVYFGTNSNPPLVNSNRSATSYDPGTLLNNRNYYWKIVAKDNQGNSTAGPRWNFTTEGGGGGGGEPCLGIPTVTYAGKTYNTIQIGSQCWLRENLDVGTMIQGSQNQSNNGTIEKYAYNNDPTNSETYGGLYQWDEAMQYVTTEGAQGICPDGWHIPTFLEFQTLRDAVGTDGNALKAIGQGTGDGAGTNTSGFSALLAGYRSYVGPFLNLDYYTFFWSSTEHSGRMINYLRLDWWNSSINFLTDDISSGLSVRCLKSEGGTAPLPPTLSSPANGATNVSLPSTLVWDASSGATSYTLQVSTNNSFSNLVFNQNVGNTTSKQISGLNNSTIYYWRASTTNSYGTSGWSNVWNFTTEGGSGGGEPCPGIPTVTYEGKTYNTVQIGNQCWLKENLDVGTIIQGIEDATDNGIIEKYCYDNDPTNCTTYGGLYQWDETMQYSITPGVQGICPPGWHIPTLAEFQTLKDAVGGNGNALKAIGQGSGGGAGTNTSGFSALLAGYRLGNGVFSGLGYSALFWSSTEYEYYNAAYAYNPYLPYNNSDFHLDYGGKDYGFNVRCLKD